MAPKKGVKKGNDAKGPSQMSKGELSKLLTGLSYTATQAKKVDARTKKYAQDALAKYRDLSPASKRLFMARVAKSRRDLSWVGSWSSARTVTEAETSRVVSGHFTRNEILDLNKFVAHTLSDSAAIALCEDLVRQSEQEFGFESSTISHENPLLSRFLYKKQCGSEHACTDAYTDSQTSTLSGAAASVHTALGNAPGSSADGQLVLKVENEKFQELNAKTVVLKSAKSTLEKFASQLEDLVVTLEVRATTDAAYAGKAKDATAAKDRLQAHIAAVRKMIVASEATTVATDCTKPLEDTVALITASEAHRDGAKLFLRHMLGVL